MAAPSPLLGFNDNVQHRGQVFHIQTEDSGVKHPHVITHLFADGGRIIKTIKSSYAEHVDSERLSDTVRDLMKRQHKAMFAALRAGRLDELIDNPGGAPGSRMKLPVAAPIEPAPASLAASRRGPAPDAFGAAGDATLDLDALERLAMDGASDPALTEGAPVTSRYAPARPAAIFDRAATRVAAEPSLDEVILRFIAEEQGDGSADR